MSEFEQNPSNMSDSQYILYRNLAECYNSAAVPSVNIQDVLKDIWVLISTVSNIESMVSVIFNMIHPIFRTSGVSSAGIRRSATTRRRCHRSMARCPECIERYPGTHINFIQH